MIYNLFCAFDFDDPTIVINWMDLISTFVQLIFDESDNKNQKIE